MPAPTSPKKRALMPSSPLRRTLRGAGHHLSPIVQIGKEGVTPALIQQLAQALDAHELVKVKVGTETPEDRFEAAERMGQEAAAQIAQVLGRTVLVYRRHPEKPRFEPSFESAAARGGRSAQDARGRKPRGEAASPGQRPTRPWRRTERGRPGRR